MFFFIYFFTKHEHSLPSWLPSFLKSVPLHQYDKTIKAVCDVENSVDMLLDLLQIYREKAGDKVPDKGSSIFTKACLLLVILLQDQNRDLVWHYYYNNNHNIMISIITLFWKSFSYN
jgi:hypothetical protein